VCHLLVDVLSDASYILGKSLLEKMRTALLECSTQERLFEKNERGWRDDDKEVDIWKEEVLKWEGMPKKWLSGDANPYRPRVKSVSFLTDASDSDPP
jgi:hypothetical protein